MTVSDKLRTGAPCLPPAAKPRCSPRTPCPGGKRGSAACGPIAPATPPRSPPLLDAVPEARDAAVPVPVAPPPRLETASYPDSGASKLTLKRPSSSSQRRSTNVPAERASASISSIEYLYELSV